jgi:hypothetical protein
VYVRTYYNFYNANKIITYIDFAKLTRKRAQNALQEQQRLAQQRSFLHHPYPPPPYLQMTSQSQNALKIAHYPGFPQHNNVSQSGNQFITTTTTPPISMVTQTEYSNTRIEID